MRHCRIFSIADEKKFLTAKRTERIMNSFSVTMCFKHFENISVKENDSSLTSSK